MRGGIAQSSDFDARARKAVKNDSSGFMEPINHESNVIRELVIQMNHSQAMKPWKACRNLMAQVGHQHYNHDRDRSPGLQGRRENIGMVGD
jgi:hypothetical protein